MRRTRIVTALLLALACAPLAAQDSTDPTRRPQEGVVLTSEAFLGAHPDLKYRLMGLDWHGQQNWERALEDFRHAARFGDKPAQGMLGEMYWNGQGVAADRAVAYAWMDLAAERGYPVLLARRELYWNAMDEGERARALVVGLPMYDEFGDDVAKPRLERRLQQARRSVTGSRLGTVGALKIIIPTVDGNVTVDGTAFWDEKYWEPEKYWHWQDHHWKKPPRGHVSVAPRPSATTTGR